MTDVPFGMHETNLAPWEQPYALPVDPHEKKICPDCLLTPCRCDPPDALVIHDAAGPCWPRYHRAMPSGGRCRCGLLTSPQ